MTERDQFFFALFRPAVIQVLRASGFHGARPLALDAFVDISIRHLSFLARQTQIHAFTNHNSPEPTITDVRMAMEDAGMFPGALTATEEVWLEKLRKPLFASRGDDELEERSKRKKIRAQADDIAQEEEQEKVKKKKKRKREDEEEGERNAIQDKKPKTTDDGRTERQEVGARESEGKAEDGSKPDTDTVLAGEENGLKTSTLAPSSPSRPAPATVAATARLESKSLTQADKLDFDEDTTMVDTETGTEHDTKPEPEPGLEHSTPSKIKDESQSQSTPNQKTSGAEETTQVRDRIEPLSSDPVVADAKSAQEAARSSERLEGEETQARDKRTELDHGKDSSEKGVQKADPEPQGTSPILSLPKETPRQAQSSTPAQAETPSQAPTQLQIPTQTSNPEADSNPGLSSPLKSGAITPSTASSISIDPTSDIDVDMDDIAGSDSDDPDSGELAEKAKYRAERAEQERFRRLAEDTRDVREFLTWFGGDVNREILRIAGRLRPEGSGGMGLYPPHRHHHHPDFLLRQQDELHQQQLHQDSASGMVIPLPPASIPPSGVDGGGSERGGVSLPEATAATPATKAADSRTLKILTSVADQPPKSEAGGVSPLPPSQTSGQNTAISPRTAIASLATPASRADDPDAQGQGQRSAETAIAAEAAAEPGADGEIPARPTTVAATTSGGMLMDSFVEEDEFADYVTVLKKKHSKTGEESRFQGTILGIPAEPKGPVRIEGGFVTTLAEWDDYARWKAAGAGGAVGAMRMSRRNRKKRRKEERKKRRLERELGRSGSGAGSGVGDGTAGGECENESAAERRDGGETSGSEEDSGVDVERGGSRRSSSPMDTD